MTLSSFDADLQVGNYLGDMLRGREIAALPPPIFKGVEMHRAIDLLTDRNEQVRGLNALIKPRHGRYATVLTDIGFDYCLYQHWDELGPEPFDLFCERTYVSIRSYTPTMPAKARRYTLDMTAGDWLQMYTTHAGMNQVFTRLRRRVSHPELLDGVESLLPDFAEEFNQVFLHLFPRLQMLADGYRS